MPSKADTAVARTIGIDTGKNTLHMNLMLASSSVFCTRRIWLTSHEPVASSCAARCATPASACPARSSPGSDRALTGPPAKWRH